MNYTAALLSAGWRRQRASIDNLAASAQAIVDGLPDPLIAVDRQRRIVRTNRAARQLLGPTVAERDLSMWVDWLAGRGELANHKIDISSLYTNEFNGVPS